MNLDTLSSDSSEEEIRDSGSLFQSLIVWGKKHIQDNIGVAPLKRKGNLFSEGNEKAQILVEQFYSVFSKKENRTLPNLPKCNKFDLPSLNITTPGIEKLLKKINVSKSVRPDNISNAILKNCASQLAPGLSAIFQKIS